MHQQTAARSELAAHVRQQSASYGHSTLAYGSSTIEHLIDRTFSRLGHHVKTSRLVNVLVIVLGLCLALYRLRAIGPWTPITIIGTVLVVFIGVVCIAIAYRRQNVTTSSQAGANAKNRNLGIILLGSMLIFLILMAGWFGYMASTVQRWERAERTWSTTEGVVESWAIRSSTDRRSGRVTWSPYWTYSFTVNGQRFGSTSIEIPSGYNAHWYASSAAAEADAMSRLVGSTVQVYYDPEHPQQSVLDRRTSNPADWVVWGLCVFLLGAAAPLGWVIFRVTIRIRAELHAPQT